MLLLHTKLLGFWDLRLIRLDLFVSNRSLTNITKVPLNHPRDQTLGMKPTAGQDMLLEAVCQVQDQYNKVSAII